MSRDIFEEPPLSEGSVATSSRFRSLWLRWFRGYRVSSTHQKPQENFFGELYYRTQWVLQKKDR